MDMNLEKLWKLYEESVIKEHNARKMEKDDNNYYTMVEAISQNGVSNGILQCIREMGVSDMDVFDKSYRIWSKVRGINIDTGFGFWVPVTERLPEKGTPVIACFDDGFITGVEFEEDGEWGLWVDSGEVVAWMPLPDPYVKDQEGDKCE